MLKYKVVNSTDEITFPGLVQAGFEETVMMRGKKVSNLVSVN